MKQVKIISTLILFILLSSCTVQKELVGNYNNTNGKSMVYEKGKDIYLFWNQVQIRDVEEDLKIVDYEKITKRNLFDNVVYYGTFGIVSFYSVKIKVKKTSEK